MNEEQKNSFLSLMDLLDLDEEIIDSRLKSLISRDSCTSEHLEHSLKLLDYKHLINLQEGTDCENTLEFGWIGKLLKDLNDENVETVCKIVTIILRLNTETLLCKSEHLIQQIIAETNENFNSEDISHAKIVWNLKVCDSILNTLIDNKLKGSFMFLELPLEKILESKNNTLINNFLASTTPKIIQASNDYNILNNIWNHIIERDRNTWLSSLHIYSILSDFYFPTPDKNKKVVTSSTIVLQKQFWELICDGINSNDITYRKTAIYLAKRAIDFVLHMKKDVRVTSDNSKDIFYWSVNKEKALKKMWDNYFVLIESLEEKQSNIVLPSLQLFNEVSEIGNDWLNAAFNLGLKHDNLQTKIICIEYRIKYKIHNVSEALSLYNAVNDMNLYENKDDIEIVQELSSLCHESSAEYLLYSLPLVSWSPVPFYFVTEILSANIKDFQSNPKHFINLMHDTLKKPCNNIILRTAVHENLFKIFCNNCKEIDNDIVQQIILCDPMINKDISKCLADWLKNISIRNDMDQDKLLDILFDKYSNKDVIIALTENLNIKTEFMNRIKQILLKICDITRRHYSNKFECLKDFVFIVKLYSEINENEMDLLNLVQEYEDILFKYASDLITDDRIWLDDEIKLFVQSTELLVKYSRNTSISKLSDKIYTMCLTLLIDSNVSFQRKVIALYIQVLLVKHNQNIQISVEHVLETCKYVKFKDDESNKGSQGRLHNKYYETLSELMYHITLNTNEINKTNIQEIINLIETITECGGYGCLKWVLRIVNKIIPIIFDTETTFNVSKFIDRMWKETEELKSNVDYLPCIEEFIKLITHAEVLKAATFNNTVIYYCKVIIDYGTVSRKPLYKLIENISKPSLTQDLGHIVFVLSEILLFVNVSKKDQRIMDNTVKRIIDSGRTNIPHIYDSTIQNSATALLFNITDKEIHSTINHLIMKRLSEMFKTKQRYHGNSQHHRLLTLGLQNMLFLLLISPDYVDFNELWCAEMLVKLPHQPNVKLYLEWYIALCLVLQEKKIDLKLIQSKSFQMIPQLSQFHILFWVMKHRICQKTYSEDEYIFTMEHLLSHTMGQQFNIRLNAQFLAVKLYELCQNQSETFTYTVKIIEKTLKDNEKEKNYIKLKSDYFSDEFDIVECLTPMFISYFTTKYFEDTPNEIIDVLTIVSVTKCKEYICRRNMHNVVIKSWLNKHLSDEEVCSIDIDELKICEKEEVSKICGAIQKKYIPWKNMSEFIPQPVGISSTVEKPGELIVVASLIDKLPNLGGLARTCEVFGAQTYVIDSLRHLQDKQFQGLSVSAEKWVNVEEVRPGKPLKEFLMMKKSEGYSVVAAEQTSNSVQLQNFKFPKKTILLLGHEKEGVPCDLLPIMDHCVEIPQQGMVRSLNVHVTAAIFIWEYTHQHIL